jgi:hypothetical protein
LVRFSWLFTCIDNSVADFYASRIPDPKTATKERGEKKYLIFELVKKKMSANLQRIIELFTQKIVVKLSKVPIPMGLDPGSGKTYSGSRIQGSKRHQIPRPGSGSASLINYIFLWLSVLLNLSLCFPSLPAAIVVAV